MKNNYLIYFLFCFASVKAYSQKVVIDLDSIYISISWKEIRRELKKNYKISEINAFEKKLGIANNSSYSELKIEDYCLYEDSILIYNRDAFCTLHFTYGFEYLFKKRRIDFHYKNDLTNSINYSMEKEKLSIFTIHKCTFFDKKTGMIIFEYVVNRRQY